MTLKRVTLFILIFALLLGCAALPAGAEHKHTWKDLPDGAIVQPTCTEPGWKIQYCTGCGITKDVKIPALGHSFTTKTYKSYADCEHYGIFYWTCSRCGYKSEGNDRPLGHDWDEGVITTKPSGFTPGVKTYTCKRDPSHTYTEEVDPEGWLFATLEEINDPDFTGKVKTLDLPPLVIVKQPEGGYVDENSDEGLVMYVEADGGEPPYTYEWYRTVQDNETLEQGKKIVADFYRLLGMSEEAISAELDQYTLESLSVLEGEEQEFHATQGYYGYYCVVTDSVKQTATSDIAKTESTVAIWTEPQNANLMDKDSVTLSCLAHRGSHEYEYNWFVVSEEDDDGWMGVGTPATEGANAGKLNEIQVDECGQYYCVVSDLGTGHKVTSRVATVYAAPQLRIHIDEPYVTLDPGVTCEFSAVISGGVPPYQVWWECDNSAIPCEETEYEDKTVSVAQSDIAGLYYIHAEDEVGNSTRQSISRYNTPIRIVKQPEGGKLPHDGSGVKVTVEVADCTLPLHYVCYRNGLYDGQFYTDEFAEELTLQDAGQYYFEITDADERSKRSDSFTIEEEDFEVTNWTRSAIIYDIDYSPTLFVFTEGGTEPFTYYWFRLEEDGKSGYWVGGNSNSLPVSVPGIYECDVQDAEGRWACSEQIPVTYTNSRPVIINQPVSHTDATRFDSGAFDCALYCRAVKANGNNSDLKYIWEIAYPVEGGWAQTTTTGQWFYPIEPGFYRCRVVDTVTGNYIYSNTATVAEKLICEKAENTGYVRDNMYHFSFSFNGGMGPYDYQLYFTYKNGEAPDWGGIRYTFGKAQDLRKICPLEYNLEKSTIFVDYSETPPRINVGELMWHMVVTDASGQKCTTPKIGVD